MIIQGMVTNVAFEKIPPDLVEGKVLVTLWTDVGLHGTFAIPAAGTIPKVGKTFTMDLTFNP